MTEYRETRAGMRLTLQEAAIGDLFVSSRPKAIIPNVWFKVGSNEWQGAKAPVLITLDAERIINVFHEYKWVIL